MNQLTVQQNVMKTMIPSCLSAVEDDSFFGFLTFQNWKECYSFTDRSDRHWIFLVHSPRLRLGDVLGISMPLLSVCKGI